MATTKKKAAKKVAKKAPAPKKAAAKKVAAKKAPAKKAAAKKAAAPAPAVGNAPRTTKVNAYLNFNGNCEEAFNHYKSVFGGKFSTIMRFKDAPPMEGANENDSNKIMHVALPISKETVLMGSDTSGAYAPGFNAGNNFALSVSAASKAGADKIFNKLADGGMVTMPIANMFWGSYFGMLTDKFGVQWMISFDKNAM